MRTRARFGRLALATLAGGAILSCDTAGTGTSPDPDPLTYIVLSGDSVVVVGGLAQLGAEGRTARGRSVATTITWTARTPPWRP